MNRQERMPFVEALQSYKEEGFVPFHTPGHKIGRGSPALLQDWMGPALPYDLGVMYALDDLHEPEGVIKEAQDLTADLYGADHCWFSINGTTALIEAMIMSVVGPGDTIIIPREAHRSVVSGLVLSGATPVYMDCDFHDRWGIPLGVSTEAAIRTMDDHPAAKAILLVYPNYYGVGVDIEAIVKAAHARHMIVLVDEAHGPHLPFSPKLPIEAIQGGADLVAQSTHKSVGSLTQTSWLLGQGPRIDERRVTQMHQMLQSTSPNYIFLASLDMARHQLATEGAHLVNHAVALSLQLRERLSSIQGISIMDNETVHAANYDVTKVLIDAKDLGLSGVEFERLLRAEKIEVELVQAYHVLVLITIGDTQESIDSLVTAVQRISDSRCHTECSGAVHRDTIHRDTIHRDSIPRGNTDTDSIHDASNRAYKTSKDVESITDGAILPKPVVMMPPRQAMYAKRKRVQLRHALHRVSGETISYYPPGIPFLAVGEEITESVIQYIENRKALGYVPNGAEDMSLETIWIVEE